MNGRHRRGLALGAMTLLRMPHSPVAATAIIGVTAASPVLYVFLAARAALVLAFIETFGNRLNGA